MGLDYVAEGSFLLLRFFYASHAVIKARWFLPNTVALRAKLRANSSLREPRALSTALNATGGANAMAIVRNGIYSDALPLRIVALLRWLLRRPMTSRFDIHDVNA